MIANKNDHDFISVVDLKNQICNQDGGLTTEIRTHESNLVTCESP